MNYIDSIPDDECLLADPPTGLRAVVVEIAKRAYRAVPMKRKAKERLLWLFFPYTGRLFVGTPAYHNWYRATHPPKLAIPTATGAVSPDARGEQLASLAFPAVAKPTVSVIIPTFGQFGHTLACLRSIARNLPATPIEIIVVDDASGDPDIRQLASIPGIHFVSNPVNLGFLRTCNAVAKRAQGEFLHFLNNDTEVTKGWLEELLRAFKERPDCGLVGSKLVFPDGRLQEAGGIVWRDGSAWNFGRFDDPLAPPYCYLKEADYVSGASIAIRRSVFEAMSGFDEEFAPAYYEDTDLAFRIREKGLKVYFQPTSVVIHHEGVSHGTNSDSGIKAYQSRNAITFFERWRDVLSRGHFDSGEGVFLAKDRGVHKKTILVIDHYVPQPDKDAGSRSIMHIIEAFVHYGLSVKFWPDNLWYDPVYTPKLQAFGVEVFYGGDYLTRLPKWLKDNGRYLDYVLLSRPHISAPIIDLVRGSTTAKILYYGHDIHHLRLTAQMKVEPGSVSRKEIQKVKQWELDIWRKADTIYYPSNDETSYVRRTTPGARARTIPVYAYSSFADPSQVNMAERTGLMFVAGFSHRPNVEGAEWFLRDVLPLVRKKLPDVPAWIIGANPPSRLRDLATGRTFITGHVPDWKLEEHYRLRRLAVAPLRYGGGMKGKVAEAMRHGVPCVTTSWGAQGFDQPTAAITVADAAEEFAQKIIELLTNDVMCLDLSLRSLRYARQHLSREALWRVLSQEVAPPRK